MAVRFVLHVVVPLVLGSMAYGLWRPNVALLRWMGVAATLPSVHSSPPAWALDHWPDAAWAYAAAAFVGVVWRDGPRGARRAWFAVALTMVAGMELAQRWHLVRGTFDVIDLAVMLASFGGAVVLTARQGRRRSPREGGTR
jgi:hypothetical protein